MVDPALVGSNSKFLKYLSWLENSLGTLPVVAGDQKPLFPCSLPYPEACSEGFAVAGVDSVSMWAKRHLNVMVAYFNYLVLGCPECSGGTCEPQAAYRSSADAKAYADELLGEVEKFGSLEVRNDTLIFKGGRLAVEEAFRKVAAVASGYGCAGVATEASGAIPVVPERVAVPAVAGTVNPCDFLPEERRQVVEQLAKLRLPEQWWPSIPTACHRVAKQDEARLVRKLLDHKMVVLVPEKDLPSDSQGNFLSGGFFCVPKNELEDRLIFDRRPENATMERIIWAELPAGACFSRMVLKPEEYLRASGDDLRNFYYALSLPQDWIRFNSVGRRVASEVVADYGGTPKEPHRMCLRVLGMGDCNACDIAQATHESILEPAGLLGPDSKMKYGCPLPDSPILDGVYLDDLLVVQRCSHHQTVPTDGSFIPEPPQPGDADVRRVAAAEEAYGAAGLQRATHKAFRHEVSFKAWGAQIDGVKGKVAAPDEMRQQTWCLFYRVVQLGLCSKTILQKLLGYSCFIFQFRRECFSVQHHIYKFVSKMPKEGWIRLPPHILDELRAMAYLIPLACWDMRKKIGTSVLSTDATPSSGGAARTTVPAALAEELWRVSEVKGEAVRMDGQPGRDLLQSFNDPKEPCLIASTMGKTLKWKATSSYTFRQTSHINLQEARALRREVARLAKNRRSGNCIQICFNDSRVVCGAVGKGRSSSYKLNGILRGMLPYLLLANISLGLIWVETDSNPADHPSRMKPIPPPSLGVPPWLAKYLGGFKGLQHCGWEIFAGSCRLTKAHRDFGVTMREPVEILLGSDAMDSSIDLVLLNHGVAWIWLAPPCCSFSPLRNWDVGGPLRPKGMPEGDEQKPEVRIGNMLWRRALFLAKICIDNGLYFFLGHPLNSRAWSMKETKQLLNGPNIQSHVAHWCAYTDHARVGDPTMKPTRIVSNAPWLAQAVERCPGTHVHGPPLRGKRAKIAGAYPWGFCCKLAGACKQFFT